MKFMQDIIKGPVLTEKSYDNIPVRKYTFEVDVKAHKTEIKQAIEEIFGVKVAKVNTVNVMGKTKRRGVTVGKRPDYKKAIVQLTEDSKTIEFFDSLN